MSSPGWYADPSDPDRSRYWDGNDWADPPAAAPAAPIVEAPIAVAPTAVAPIVAAPTATGLPTFASLDDLPPPSAGAAPAPIGAPGGFVPPAGGFVPPSAAPAAPAAESAANAAWGAPGGGAPMVATGMSVGAAGAGAVPAPALVAQPAAAPAPMHRYEPEPSALWAAGGATGKGGVAAALLGLQASIPLLAGLGSLLVGNALNEFGGSDFGGSSFGSASQMTLLGVAELAFGILMLLGAVGAAMGRSWGRVLAMVTEVVVAGVILWSAVRGGEATGAVLVALPLVVIYCVATDDARS